MCGYFGGTSNPQKVRLIRRRCMSCSCWHTRQNNIHAGIRSAASSLGLAGTMTHVAAGPASSRGARQLHYPPLTYMKYV